MIHSQSKQSTKHNHTNIIDTTWKMRTQFVLNNDNDSKSIRTRVLNYDFQTPFLNEIKLNVAPLQRLHSLPATHHHHQAT